MSPRRTVPHAGGQWSRRRLLAVFASVVLVAVLLLVSLVLTVAKALDDDASGTQSGAVGERYPVGSDGTRGDGYRDAMAATPMLATSADDMRPAAPALTASGSMRIPPATTSGSEGVPSGFEQSPEGAVAQLAAIETTVLTPMSVDYARRVFAAWSMPGAVFADWTIARSISAFHASAGTVDGDGTVSLTATPAGAQIKATDGPEWVLACVQLDVWVSVVEDVRFGYGNCDRMVWTGNRWVIDAGTPPAAAPSTWPGSDRSREAGWLTWVQAGES